MYESDIEKYVIEELEKQGAEFLQPDEWELERDNLTEVVLKERLIFAVNNFNPNLPAEAKDEAIKKVLNLSSQELIENNEEFHRLITEGVTVEILKDGEERGETVQIIDFENPDNNEFVVCNQYYIRNENGRDKIPDVVLFVNGLPLVVIELKNATDEQATTKKAYTQLQNYKDAVPQLFFYNALLIASDGLDAKVGSLTADWSRFVAWKSIDGKKEEALTKPQIDVLIQGLLRHDVLLDVIKHYTVFEKEKHEDPGTKQQYMMTIKKIAAYHQYFAVKKAVESTKKAASEKGDQKAGVIWHTQGSGKSLSMVFYTGEIVLELDNPTVVVLTDRNDLDDQLFGTFIASRQLLRQDPVQAESRDHLKDLLKVAGGGIVFTTIQKFWPEEGNEFEELSKRKNIIVIADEAHRSQYGLSAKTKIDEKTGEAKTAYGFAKYLRDALPHASFLGFTGTPIEKGDKSTPAVFGDYIDVYDIEQAIEDGATRPIYYESRLVKIHLDEEEKEKIDEEIESLTEGEESHLSQQAKSKWTKLESIIGNKERLKKVAEDMVNHFETRQETFEGKGMIVSMSRRIAVDLYEEIIKLKPEWHSEDKYRGAIKVIMTSSSSDPSSWQIHHTSKDDRKMLADRLRDPADELKLVIVRDMWLTGFDAPVLNVMYVDKPMRGHNLMQAIARVNRVYKDKPGGLIVDYVGIASDLKNALATYTESGGEGKPYFDIHEAITIMLEKYEIVEQMLHQFGYEEYFEADTQRKLSIILETQEYILQQQDGANRFMKNVEELSKMFALCSAEKEAKDIREEVAFFQAVKSRLAKFERSAREESEGVDMETAIKQIIDKAVAAEGVVDIFEAAGLDKPDISVLSDEFLMEVKNMKHKNLAVELLKKVINNEVKVRLRKNAVQDRKVSEMLEDAIKRYQNNLISAAEVIEELIEIAREIRKSDERPEEMGLTEDELAFYDALADNESAKEVLGDDTLRELSRILVEKVRKNTSIDWTIRESAQAKIRVLVKRTLNKYGYPPDQQKIATDTVLKQATLFADDWANAPVEEYKNSKLRKMIGLK